MLRDLLLKNRSYRGYDESRTVSREELEELVELTRYTASSMNRQPLKYHIAYETEEVCLIQSMTKWAAALPELELPYPGSCPTGFIVICLDTSVHPNLNVFLRDIGIASQTILLGAVEKGLGGCMIGNFPADKLKEALHLPAQLQPNLVVAIGKPAENVVLTEVGEDGSTGYTRDESGKIHYVPKRSLKELLV